MGRDVCVLWLNDTTEEQSFFHFEKKKFLLPCQWGFLCFLRYTEEGGSNFLLHYHLLKLQNCSVADKNHHINKGTKSKHCRGHFLPFKNYLLPENYCLHLDKKESLEAFWTAKGTISKARIVARKLGSKHVVKTPQNVLCTHNYRDMLASNRKWQGKTLRVCFVQSWAYQVESMRFNVVHDYSRDQRDIPFCFGIIWKTPGKQRGGIRSVKSIKMKKKKKKDTRTHCFEGWTKDIH